MFAITALSCFCGPSQGKLSNGPITYSSGNSVKFEFFLKPSFKPKLALKKPNSALKLHREWPRWPTRSASRGRCCHSARVTRRCLNKTIFARPQCSPPATTREKKPDSNPWQTFAWRWRFATVCVRALCEWALPPNTVGKALTKSLFISLEVSREQSGGRLPNTRLAWFFCVLSLFSSVLVFSFLLVIPCVVRMILFHYLSNLYALKNDKATGNSRNAQLAPKLTFWNGLAEYGDCAQSPYWGQSPFAPAYTVVLNNVKKPTIKNRNPLLDQTSMMYF